MINASILVINFENKWYLDVGDASQPGFAFRSRKRCKINERFLLPESTKDKKMSTELSSIPAESKKVSTELRSIPVESVEMNWMGTDICSLSESNYFGQATCELCF